MALLLPLSFAFPPVSFAILAFQRPRRVAAAVWKAWRRQAANQELLARIDDHLCHDIGVSAERLAATLRRPWWRDPAFRADLKG